MEHDERLINLTEQTPEISVSAIDEKEKLALISVLELELATIKDTSTVSNFICFLFNRF